MTKEKLGRIRKIRSFNRFYTNLLGLLESKLLKSEYSLNEVRIMFELNRLSNTTASKVGKLLIIDPAHLSRILSSFEEKNLIQKERSSEDMRKQLISLTSKGQDVLSDLQKRANEQIKTLLDGVTEDEQKRLVSAMRTIKSILKGEVEQIEIYTLRSHKPGDIGYVTYQHGVIYASEYNLDETFEAYVAAGLSQFIENYDSAKDHLWIVENGKIIVGSIAIVKFDSNIAQLRWFLVEPRVRDKGIGKKLMQEAISFCNYKGYSKIILWTLKNLTVARSLYKKTGFQLKETKSSVIWGQDLTEELWELKL